MSFISTRKVVATMLPLVIAASAISPAVASAKTAGGTASLQACALLPDTKSSTRYTLFDAPYLTAAFKKAGISAQVLNAQGSSARQKSQAEGCLAKGAKVILLDPFTTAAGSAITAEAVSQGAKVIDYDRLVPGARSRTTSPSTMSASASCRPRVSSPPSRPTALSPRSLRSPSSTAASRTTTATVQAGLRLDPEPAVQARRHQEGDRRRPVDRLGSGQGPHDLRSDARPQQQQHQRRAGGQ